MRTVTTVVLMLAVLYGLVWTWQAWNTGNWQAMPGFGSGGGGASGGGGSVSGAVKGFGKSLCSGWGC